MNPRFRKIAVFAGAAVLAGGVGVAVASQGGEDTGSRAAMTQGMPGQPGGGQVQGTVPGQGQGGQTQGGQSQGAVPGGPPGAGGPGGIDLETLAEKLGVSTDDLQAALQDLRPEPPTQIGREPARDGARRRAGPVRGQGRRRARGRASGRRARRRHPARRRHAAERHRRRRRRPQTALS